MHQIGTSHFLIIQNVQILTPHDHTNMLIMSEMGHLIISTCHDQWAMLHFGSQTLVDLHAK